MSVVAKAEGRPDVTASTEAVGNKEDYTLTGKAFNKNSENRTGVSISLAFGYLLNQADANINGNADVDSQGKISVKADSLNELDLEELWGINLVTPFLGIEDPDYKSTDGIKTLTVGQTVKLDDDHEAGGNPGERYQYRGTDGNSIDLSEEDYSDVLVWEPVGALYRAAREAVGNLINYLDSNLGLDKYLVDSWSQAKSGNQRVLAISISASGLTLTLDADAGIRSGARINQDPDGTTAGGAPDAADSFRTGNQDVVVQATGINDAINLVGNFQSFGVSNLINSTESYKTWTPGVRRSQVIDPKKSAGASLGGYIYISNVTAKIEDGVVLYADSLKVNAENGGLGVTLGASGGKSTRGGNGVLVLNVVANTTKALIEEEADITIGENDLIDGDGKVTSLLVSATDSTFVIGVAGSYARGERVGVGVSLGLAVISRDTQAVIGITEDESSEGNTTNTLTVGGGVSVYAANSGFVGTISVGAAKAVNSPETRIRRGGQSFGGSGANSSSVDYDVQFKSVDSVAVAASAAVNVNYDTIYASLNLYDLGAGRDVEVESHSETLLEAFSIGAAWSKTGAQVSSNIAASGALSYNAMITDIDASIHDATVTATDGGVSVLATDKSKVNAHSGAVAIAWNQDKDATGRKTRSVSVGASIAVNDLSSGDGYSLTAEVDSAYLIADKEILVQAKSNVDVHSVAVGGALSKATSNRSSTSDIAGAGAGALALNFLTQDIQARIRDSDVETTAGSDADIIIAADHDPDLFRADAFGVAVTYSGTQTGNTTPTSLAQSVSVGAAVAVNVLEGAIDATIENSQTTNDGGIVADGDLLVEATSDPHLNTLAVGVAAAVVNSITGGVAGAGAGSLAMNLVTNKVRAIVQEGTEDGYVFDVGGDVSVTAKENTISRADAGGFAISLSRVRQGGSSTGNSTAVAIGASLAINEFGFLDEKIGEDYTTDSGTQKMDFGDKVRVKSDHNAGGTAGTIYRYVGADKTEFDLGNTNFDDFANWKESDEGQVVKAQLKGVDLTAANDVLVVAESNARLYGLAMGGAFSGALVDKPFGSAVALSGAGAGSYNTIEQKIESSIKGSSSITTLGSVGDVDVLASDRVELDGDAGGVAVAIAAATGDTTGSAVSGSVGAANTDNRLAGTIRAIVDHSTIDAAEDVTVSAESRQRGASDAEYRVNAFALGIAGAGAGSSTNTGFTGAFAGAGSLAINQVDNDIESTIAYSTIVSAMTLTVTAFDDVSVLADSGGYAVSVSASDASATSVGSSVAGAIGFSLAINEIGVVEDHSVIATIDNTTVKDVKGDLTVSATSEASIDSQSIGFAGSGAGSTSTSGLNLALSGAGAGSYNTIIQTVKATAEDSSLVTSNGGDVNVSAIDSSEIWTDAGGVGVAISALRAKGASAAATASGSVGIANADNTVEMTVKAFLDNTTVNAGGNINLTADSRSSTDDKIDFGLDAIDDNDDIFTIEKHGLKTGDRVVYRNRGSDGEELGDLVDGTSYTVVRLSKHTFQLTQDNETISLDTTNAGTDHRLETLGSYKIDALAFGVSVAAAGSSSSAGTGFTGSLAGAGSIAYNEIDSEVAAYISNAPTIDDVEGIISGGSLTLSANDNASIRADSGGYALALAGTTGNASTGTGSIGASISINNIGEGGGHSVDAYIENSEVSVDNDVLVDATSTAEIASVSIGAAASGSGSTGGNILSGALSLAGAGAGSYNTIDVDLNSYISYSSVTTAADQGGNLLVSANDFSEIWSDTGGVALAVALGRGTDLNLSVSVGVAVAMNEISNKTKAYVDSSDVMVDNNVTVSADSGLAENSNRDYRIDALAFGVAASVSGTSADFFSLTGSLAGAGSGATNTVDNTVKAYITNSDDVTATNGDVTVEASDSTSIRADTGGYTVGIAVGRGSGSGTLGGAVGASASYNYIGKDGGHSVEAYIDNSTIDAGADVIVNATSEVEIEALAIGGSAAVAANTGSSGLAVGFTGAGAGTDNQISVDVEARITNESEIISGGNVTLGALDETTITADAGGVAVALAITRGSGGSGAFSVGAGVANNDVSNDVNAFIDSSTVDASGDLSLSAKSTSPNGDKINAFALGLAISGSLTGTGVSLTAAGAGAESINTIDNSVLAYILDSVDSQGGAGIDVGGSITILAMDESEITAEAGGYAIALAGGSELTLGGSVGASVSKNNIGTDGGHDIGAFITRSNIEASSTLAIDAMSTSTIDAFAMGGALAGTAGSGSAGTAAAAGAGTYNKVKADITAAVNGYAPELGEDETDEGTSSISVEDTNKDLFITATDDSSITSDAGGVAVAIAIGTGGGAGGGAIGLAISENEINNDVLASLEDAAVDIADDLNLSASSVAEIVSYSFGGAAAVTYGSSGSVSLAGAGAGSSNTVSNNVKAYIQDGDGTLLVGGNLTIEALDDSSIDSQSDGGSVAISGSPSGGASIAITAVESINDVDNNVLAFIETTSIEVDKTIAITAETAETNLVNSGAVASSISLAISPASAGLSGGGAGSYNEITNDVKAYIDGDSSVVTAGAGLDITASDNAAIESDVGVVSVAGGLVSISVGVSVTDNQIDNDVHAYVDSEVSVTTGGIDIMANSMTVSEGVGFATSVAVGVGAFAGAGAGTYSTVGGTVKAYVGSQGDLTVSDDGGEVNILATSDQDVSAEAVGAAISAGVGVSIGVMVAEAYIEGSTQAYLAGTLNSADAINIIADNNSKVDAVSESLAGGVSGLSGAGAGSVASIDTSSGNPSVTAYITGSVGSSNAFFDGDVRVRSIMSTDADSSAHGVA